MGSSRKGRDIDAALIKKGFKKTNGDHVWYHLYDPLTGATLAQTKMSHGVMGSSVSAKLISQMARQLRLTKSQFLEFVDCTLSEESYRAVLTEHGFGA